METLYILMFRQMHFVGKGDPDHWEEVIIAQSTDKPFIDNIVKKNKLSLGDINDIWDFNHKYFIKEMPAQYINEGFFKDHHFKR